MVGFEIRCVHRDRRYSEWAVVEQVAGQHLPSYRASWIRERDHDRRPIPGMFGLWIEDVFGGYFPKGGWWLWGRAGNRARTTHRLLTEWPMGDGGRGWHPASNGAGPRQWFVSRDAADGARGFHLGANGQLVRYGSCEAAQRAADRLNP